MSETGYPGSGMGSRDGVASLLGFVGMVRGELNAPLVAIGVVTMLPSKRDLRGQEDAALGAALNPRAEAIRASWATMMPQHRVAVRFVIRCDKPELELIPMVWCSRSQLEHPKTIEWFAHALREYPNTPWISHADDDAWVNTRVLYHELIRIPPVREAYGLMMFMRLDFDNRIVPNMGQFRDPSLVNTRTKEKGSTLYPFMQGGFYTLSRDMVGSLVPYADSMYQGDFNRSRLKQLKLGEDAFVFLALHKAAAASNTSYRMRDLTWTRSHFLPANPGRMEFAMGWHYPSNASSVVHWIKHDVADFWLVHNISGGTRQPAFAPFRWEWHPTQARWMLRFRRAALRVP